MSLGFYFDMTRCMGCRACQVACKDKNNLDIGTIFRRAKTFTVGQDEIFAMGDHRSVSLDSRSPDVGMVQEDSVVGKAFVRLFPFNEIGLL